MITLIIRPDFNFKLGKNEAGDYTIYLPQNSLPICKMWCSSLRWLSTDISYEEFLSPLKKVLGHDEIKFDFDFNKSINLDEINKNNYQIDLERYCTLRYKYNIPPWEERDLI